MRKYKILIVIFSMFCFSSFAQNKNSKENIIFIIVDDLRDLVMAENQLEILTPNIDKLRKRGVEFENSFTNYPVCGASRASILTGLRPTKSRFRNYDTQINKDAPNSLTIASYLKKNGYRTISNGKISHYAKDASYGWDDMFRSSRNNPKDYQDPLNIKNLKNNFGPASEFVYADDNDYSDGKVTQKTIQDIQSINKNDKPYFIAVGFQKPHLPFIAPKKYWDLYDRNTIMQPENYNYTPVDAPKMSISNWSEMRSYSNIPNRGQVSDSLAIDLIHGYYATVSYTDALIGKILNELKEQELDKNTVVVFVSDHGYNLQEHTQWAKFTNYNSSTQVPLIIYNPLTKVKGTTNALSSLVDVYPTLAEICGIEAPKGQLDGTSLVPILNNPNMEGKKYVFIKKGNGFTLKTREFSYTEYIKSKDNSIIARMLYDHRATKTENVNIVNKTEFKNTVLELNSILHLEYQKNIEGN